MRRDSSPRARPLPHRAYYARPTMQSAHLVLASWTLPRTRAPFAANHASMRFGLGRPAAIQSSVEAYGQVDIVPNPPHSLASDAWKGLVFSLMAGNRNAEALAEIGKIPNDVRRQLEADIEWVQGIASLYFAVGDTPHATLYLNRVENYYLVHRTSTPGSLEVQHAWLLYNLRDDAALYPLLAAPRCPSGSRPRSAPAGGNSLGRLGRAPRQRCHARAAIFVRGVEILQAASQDYPDNMTVRLAVAGAYARVGRSQEAVTLFKSLNMNDASAGDFQGAISAAISAADMAQAEAWLRIALGKYPNDPMILGLAARFEQARGNNERAAAFWRAAIAAMPPGSSVKSLDYGLVMPPGTTYHTPSPGDTKHLLDPRLDPTAQRRPSRAAAFLQAADHHAGSHVRASERTPVPPPQITAPSTEPLPLPPSANYIPNGQGTAPSNQPIYVPQAVNRNPSTSGPVLVEQSNSEPPSIPAAVNGQNESAAQRRNRQHHRQRPGTRACRRWRRIILRRRLRRPPISALHRSPWQPAAAQTQALFADQTDNQLTQGSGTVIHNVPNAPVTPMPTVQAPPSNSNGQGTYDMAQYTPSAQEAATGAYSAPQQQTQQQQPQAAQQPPAKPQAGSSTRRKRKKTQQEQTLGNAPITSNPPPEATAPPSAVRNFS